MLVVGRAFDIRAVRDDTCSHIEMILARTKHVPSHADSALTRKCHSSQVQADGAHMMADTLFVVVAWLALLLARSGIGSRVIGP